jgi:beta-glucosidase
MQAGNVTVQQMVASLNRSLPWAFRLGLMDPDEDVPYTKLGPADVDTPAARQLALEAAQQGMVLLQNNATDTPWGANQPLLPLRTAGAKFQKLVVIGPNAGPQDVMGSAMLSNYHGENTVYESHMPMDSIASRASAAGLTVLPWVSGCADTECNGTAGFAAAVAAAQAADVSILVMGLSPGYNGRTMPGTVEGEEEDRADLNLPGDQLQLIQACTSFYYSVSFVIYGFAGGGSRGQALYCGSHSRWRDRFGLVP